MSPLIHQAAPTPLASLPFSADELTEHVVGAAAPPHRLSPGRGGRVQPGLDRRSPRTHLRRIEPLTMLAQDLEEAYLNATFDYLPKGAACSPSSEEGRQGLLPRAVR
jgi:hypothetical protein